MDRDEDFRPNPIIKRRKFRLPRVTRNMHMRLLFRHCQDIAFCKLVHDCANGDFITRYLLGRENDRVTFLQLHRVIALGYARQSGARFPLPARRNHHDILS